MSIHNKYRCNDEKCIIHKRNIMIHRHLKKCAWKRREKALMLLYYCILHSDRLFYYYTLACYPHFVSTFIPFFIFLSSIDPAYHYELFHLLFIHYVALKIYCVEHYIFTKLCDNIYIFEYIQFILNIDIKSQKSNLNFNWWYLNKIFIKSQVMWNNVCLIYYKICSTSTISSDF